MRDIESSINIDIVKTCVELTLKNESVKEAIKSGSRNEEFFYPYFNVELLKHLDIEKIKGIGLGSPSYQVREKIDCLVVFDDDYKVAIELKGPLNTSGLLSNAGNTKKCIRDNAKFTDRAKELEICLEQAYCGKVYYGDSKIGDIVKLLNLINENRIHEGYCIGLLHNKKWNEENRKKYKSKLRCMIDCVRPYVQPKNMDISVAEYSCVKDLEMLISISQVRKVEKVGLLRTTAGG